MPQAVGETVFDVFYLGFAMIAGFTMLLKGNSPLVKKAGLMAVLLGAGDSFHLIPRCIALWTSGLEANAAALGTGKFITSITMTIFYLISGGSVIRLRAGRILQYQCGDCPFCVSPCVFCRKTSGFRTVRRFCTEYCATYRSLLWGLSLLLFFRGKQKGRMTAYSALCRWRLSSHSDFICRWYCLAGLRLRSGCL